MTFSSFANICPKSYATIPLLGLTISGFRESLVGEAAPPPLKFSYEECSISAAGGVGFWNTRGVDNGWEKIIPKP